MMVRKLFMIAMKITGTTLAGLVAAIMVTSAAHADGTAAYHNKSHSTSYNLYMAPGNDVCNGCQLFMQKGVKASQFYFYYTLTSGTNVYKFESDVTRYNTTHQMLDVAGKKTANGSLLNYWQNTNASNQRFRYTGYGDGWNKFEPRHTDNKCLDRQSGAEGAKVYIWECNGTDPQRWKHLYW